MLSIIGRLSTPTLVVAVENIPTQRRPTAATNARADVSSISLLVGIRHVIHPEILEECGIRNMIR
ncbi:hypothetical protein KP79_PYT19857 [Mizuhopecten yessoensis]|uniref:Uncharacterized protein n=1 Tax=Mizuhopecten yessoensis TaxID=6573 RepID=A0A210PSH9_MIZYE|nr:hypothetical protein KP79_PYT19857 [Mizuhopecten yessoensis]